MSLKQFKTPRDFAEAGLKLLQTASLAATTEEDLNARREFGVRQARLELQNRRARCANLSNHLFGEPAWTMLLELYVSSHQSRPISVTSLCALSDEPQTTALRWISILEDEELVERSNSGTDRRVREVALTDHALQQLDHYFSFRKHHLL